MLWEEAKTKKEWGYKMVQEQPKVLQLLYVYIDQMQTIVKAQIQLFSLLEQRMDALGTHQLIRICEVSFTNSKQHFWQNGNVSLILNFLLEFKRHRFRSVSRKWCRCPNWYQSPGIH